MSELRCVQVLGARLYKRTAKRQKIHLFTFHDKDLFQHRLQIRVYVSIIEPESHVKDETEKIGLIDNVVQGYIINREKRATLLRARFTLLCHSLKVDKMTGTFILKGW